MGIFNRLFGKKEKAVVVDSFSFIESPNVISIKIEMDSVEGVKEADSLDKQASIIWSYTDMKTKVLKGDGEKKAESLVDSLMSEVVESTGNDGETAEENVEDREGDNSPGGVVESKDLYLKKEGLGPDNDMMVVPKSPDHNLSESIKDEELVEAKPVDLDEMGSNQDL